MNQKLQLRKQLRQIRMSIPTVKRKKAEHRTNALLKRFIRRGKRIAAYWPIGSELDLTKFTHCVQQYGAKIYLPYIENNKRRLWFTLFDPTLKAEKQHNRHSLRIPQFTGRKIRAEQLDLMILPIIGIDKKGRRLGQGGGFYDTTLGSSPHRHRPKTVAVGFCCQSCTNVYAEPHDCSVDYFVCEHGITSFVKKNQNAR